MPSCLMCGRSRNARSRKENISFHRFPVAASMREKWNHFVLQNSLQLKQVVKDSLLCSQHFLESDFLKFYKNKTKLKREAVPCLVVSRVKSSTKMYPEHIRVGDVREPTIKPTSCTTTSPLVSNSFSSCSSPSLDSTQSLDDEISSEDEDITLNSILSLDTQDLPHSARTSTVSDTERPPPMKNLKSSFLNASKPSVTDTPMISYLKKGIEKLSRELSIKNKKLKAVQQIVRRQNQKIVKMRAIINQFNTTNNDDVSEMLLETFEI